MIGATYPEELRRVGEVVRAELPILIPGIGAQGGDLDASVRAAVADGGNALYS